METVIRHFVTNPQRCQSKAGKTHCQTNHADQRLVFVFPHGAESDLEIVCYQFTLSKLRIFKSFDKDSAFYKILNLNLFFAISVHLIIFASFFSVLVNKYKIINGFYSRFP
jgi:hypothetical protein